MPEPGTGRETSARAEQLHRLAPLPDLPSLRRLARRRRWRRLTGASGAVLLILALFAGAGLFGPPHSPKRSPPRTASPPPAGSFAYTNAALATDGSEGLAVQHTCRVGGCRVLVWQTRDQGRSWEPTQRLPSLLGLASSPLTPVVTAAGTGALLDAEGQPTLTLGPRGGWRSVRQSASPLARLAGDPGWVVSTRYGQTVGMAAPHNTVRACNLTASWCRPLAHQPPIARVTWVQLDGRRLWAAGLSGTGAALLAISSDAGRSWRAVSLAGARVDTLTITDTADR